MIELQIYNENGKMDNLDTAINNIPNRTNVVYNFALGVCTVYQIGDKLPEMSLETALKQARSAALEELRIHKWTVKNSGVVVDGVKIDTDDKGQETISGAVINCLINPDFKTVWKTADTNADGTAVWVEVNKDMIFALSDALTKHTEKCFAIEAVKQEEVSKLTTVEEINEWVDTKLKVGW